MTHWINVLPLLIVLSGCLVFLSTNRILFMLGSAGMIFLAGFVIDVQFNSTLSTFVRLTVSLAALLMIYMSIHDKDGSTSLPPINLVIFKSVGFVMLVIVAVIVGISFSRYLNLPLELVLVSLIEVFCGVLLLGMSRIPLSIILGILLFFHGFGIIYGSFEPSLLVNGLLSAVNLLLGGIGTYFVVREVKMVDQ